MRLGHLTYPAAILLAGALMISAANAGQTSFSRELDKVGRDLCKSLDLKCKPKRTVRKKVQTRKAAKVSPTKPKKPAVKPAPVKPAVAVAPETPPAVPIPRLKPVKLSVAVAPKAPLAVPIPRPKPAMPELDSGDTVPAPSIPTVKPPVVVAVLPMPPPPKLVMPAVPDKICLAALKASNVEFETAASPVANGLCQIDTPVRLSAVVTARGRIVLPDRPTLNCQFARQFALWLSTTKTTLAKVSTGPGYECRGRNGDATAKLSEHAFGNAVDITTITTQDGRTIQVSDAIVTTSPAFEPLRGLRSTACAYFTTVLGPGANAAHASHFHFDMAVRGKSGTYRICE